MTDQTWRKCSSCREPIAYKATYWVCNVSTCNGKRIPTFFCTVSCWEAHLPTMRHREAWAVEKTAPSRSEAQESSSPAPRSTSSKSSTSASTSAPARRRAVDSAPARDDELPRDILIVASKMKKYIKAKSGFNTSENVLKALSEHVRALCDQAIRNAGQDERKTVMDRDFPPAR